MMNRRILLCQELLFLSHELKEEVYEKVILEHAQEPKHAIHFSVWFLTFSLFFVVILLIFMQGVYALGITPGRTTFDYKAGETKKVSFDVINTENKNLNLVVLVQGELNNSIAVSEVSFEMKVGEEKRTLSYELTMPAGLRPGLRTAEVVVLALPGKSETSEAFIGAAVGVATQIHVYVPYPGKYAEASLNIIGPSDDGELIFVMPVVSRGEVDLVRVRGLIDIFTSLNEKVTTLSTNEVSIKSGQREEIVAKWKPENILSGRYKAIATLIYDEETLNLENEFSIGSRLLELLQVEVNNFVLGGIAKFELLVENKWSEAIIGAYAQMQVFNNKDEVMADFKSATYDINPLEKKLLVAFWDTAGVNEGTYDSTVFLNYGARSERQDFKIEVKEREINVIGVGYVISSDSGGESSLTTILIIGIVVLVLINLLWFLVLRKKLKRRVK